MNCCRTAYVGLGLTLLLLCRNTVVVAEVHEEPQNKESQVEVRAVFINCKPNELQDHSDSEILRFERQELFKHNALRGCNKKLAVTVKMASVPEPYAEIFGDKSFSAGDEYVPIDHVFEGSSYRKRVRLLNPYVLRLHREMPRQAYKLHRIDTVNGVLTNTESIFKKQNRERRDSSGQESEDTSFIGSSAAVFSLEHDNPSKNSYSVRLGRLQELIKPQSHPDESVGISKDCGLRLFSTSSQKSKETEPYPQDKHSTMNTGDNQSKDKREICSKYNATVLVREKRFKSFIDEVTAKVRSSKDRFYQRSHDSNLNINEGKSTRTYVTDGSEIENHNNKVKVVEVKPREKLQHSLTAEEGLERNYTEEPINERFRNDRPADAARTEYDSKILEDNILDKNLLSDRHFALYEIGSPNLWYNIKVQLFEKLSTPEGKTVWNDLTKGEQVSVSSSEPVWRGQGLDVRYRPTEWVPRDDYTLPMTRLCLLEPLRDPNDTSFDYDPIANANSNREYIVVPIEDVVYINLNKRDGNASAGVVKTVDSPNLSEEDPRRVEVRISRAIIGGYADSFNIAVVGDDRYLTLPHRRPHHAQIDLEVRADDNQLVRVGSSGRIATVVADGTRKTRTTIHVQVTNTGLASARFKVAARDCGPELMSLMKEKGKDEIASGPFLLPPQHTKRLRLQVPIEIPVDTTHCNVQLMNNEDESLAVREVAIKKGDRCFCVWHCDCVCLSEDPKLLCREMTQPQQVAAGLSTADRPRYTRSVRYADNLLIDVGSLIVGVIAILLMLGLTKAILGLFSRKIGQWGFDRILKMPRRLESYYEDAFKDLPIVYDNCGWPVHPLTNQRTVRIVSCPVEFIINLVIFVVLPSIALCGIAAYVLRIFEICAKRARCKIRKVDEQIFSTADLQSESLELVMRRKRRVARLRHWMTPTAEDLAADILQDEVASPSTQRLNRFRITQPLLHEMKFRSGELSVGDSEQEDTDYVLTQMQKSRESLARSQKKVNDSTYVADKNPSQIQSMQTSSKH